MLQKCRLFTGLLAVAVGMAAYTPADAESLSKGLRRIRDQTATNLKHVRDEGEDALQRTANSFNKFVNDPVDYILSRPERLFSEICAAPIRTYEYGLRAQAKDRWKSLPSALIKALQPHYGNVDLRSVAYAEGIGTSNGAAQAIGKQIYFPRSLDLRSPNDLHWMLHELEHTQQYGGARYGTNGKLCEYVAKSVGNGFQHDRIDIERAADRKADYLINFALAVMNTPQLSANQIQFTNRTTGTIVFYVQTAVSAREEVVLRPNEYTLFTSPNSVTWYNFDVNTMGHVISYGLDGGAYYDVAYNQAGFLDAFQSQVF